MVETYYHCNSLAPVLCECSLSRTMMFGFIMMICCYQLPGATAELYSTVLGSAVGGTAEKALAGLPYVKFSEAAGDKHKHPQVPTVGKYEAVVGHKEVSRYGVTQQLKLLNSQSSITSQYAPTYDYIQRDNEYASVGYYCVPPAVSPCIHIPLMHYVQ